MGRLDVVDVIADATALPLATDAFDIALCVHVLEHIDDDTTAIAELHRSLRPGGLALVSVPLSGSATYEDSSVRSPEARRREFGERSHVRLYGMDVADRLRAGGFDVQVDLASDLPANTRHRYGLRDDDHLFLCSKLTHG